MAITAVNNKLNYSDKFENSINKLKSEGRYRVFNETQRKVGFTLWQFGKQYN